MFNEQQDITVFGAHRHWLKTLQKTTRMLASSTRGGKDGRKIRQMKSDPNFERGILLAIEACQGEARPGYATLPEGGVGRLVLAPLADLAMTMTRRSRDRQAMVADFSVANDVAHLPSKLIPYHRVFAHLPTLTVDHDIGS
jgi:hypothetical protein